MCHLLFSMSSLYYFSSTYNTYIERIYTVSNGPQLANKISNTVSPLSYVHSVVNSIVISTITALEVGNIILSTKNSSPGWDDIPACVAKKCIDHYIDPLTHIINNSIQEGVFPSE